ncbi:MAG: hypothetical protein COB02_12270 [Candidatus Cloacimonadota bacterium]|nr:MAG: hypothetical protein COB02_12270 [Candidatus Cloacimonadota bacterium]
MKIFPLSSTYLILSVDIVGSTAFKNKYESREWLPTIKQFYIDFPSHFYDEIHTLNKTNILNKQEFKISKEFVKIWKYLGDEILFYIDLQAIQKESHAIFYVYAFLKAIDSCKYYKEGRKDKPEITELSSKGTAWIASFPITNSIVVKNPIDFIGPQIDTGFRLGKFSDPTKFIISVELAWVMLQFYSDKSNTTLKNDIKINFHFDEMTPLKGVLAGQPYPIIFINLIEGKNQYFIELKYSLLNKSKDEHQLFNFCKEFIKVHSDHMEVPYVYSELNEPDLKIFENEYNKAISDVLHQSDELDSTLSKNEDNTEIKEITENLVININESLEIDIDNTLTPA